MALELGDVGTSLRMENDHIKVWDLILEPGDASPWHRHTMQYVFVVYEAGRLRGEFEDGTVNEKDYLLGQVSMGHKDSVHRVINTGSSRFRNVVIELKE